MQPTDLFKYTTRIAESRSRVYEYFCAKDAFQRLLPPWLEAKIHKIDTGIDAGNQIDLTIRRTPFLFHYQGEIIESDEEEQFTDLQIKGPFSYFRHNHRFHHLDQKTSLIEDVIRYQLPGGFFLPKFVRKIVRKELLREFSYRARTIQNDLSCFNNYPKIQLRILVTGASGFVGSALVPFLRVAGHTVHTLTSHPTTDPESHFWDHSKPIPLEFLEGFNVIIHLSGASIAKRWNDSYKKLIYASRIDTTTALVEACKHLIHPPQLFLCASAIGYYGNRNEELCTEFSTQGEGFLSQVCHDWEAAAQQFPGRSVQMRFGAIISPRGGILQKMLLPFSLGLGAVLGSGNQYMSWIALDDLLQQIYHMLFDASVEGPINLTSPIPVTHEEFCNELATFLNRPVHMRIPEYIIKKVFGEMGSELMLSSTKVAPSALLSKGSLFTTPTIRATFDHCLGALRHSDER